MISDSISSEPVPTIQELFDRAWHGLREQGWKRAVNEQGTCQYLVPETGCRCAWGHADLSLTSDNIYSGNVADLHKYGVGLAARLDSAGLAFAKRLQLAHDGAAAESADNTMEMRLRRLAAAYTLTVPEPAL